MQDRTKTYYTIAIQEADDDFHDVEAGELPPMTDRERLKLAEKIEAYGVSCATRREREAQRRLDKAAKFEAEAAALRGQV